MSREYSKSTYDRFESGLESVLTEGDIIENPHTAAVKLRTLVEERGIQSREAREYLANSGIRKKWNTLFATDRAQVLGRWISPWLRDYQPAADVMAGDCILTGEIADLLGADIIAFEHLGHYPEIRGHSRVRPVDLHGDLETMANWGIRLSASSALLCAVLHHEEEPEALLRYTLKTGIRRIIVVENCVDTHNTSEFHHLMDMFFNRCLNDFGSSCTRQHRTQSDWISLVENIGLRLVFTDELQTVPALPFPHQLMIFDF
ncbi:hypothetical protein [Nocardia carnea]|uniref:hypothetical protein n=1 Tax=Nocardia carnea TaxID=37328 RepID=UPI002454D92C|nr:hypothetical protein [Nocardia carnea]